MTTVSIIPHDEIGAIHHAMAVIEHDYALLPYAICDACIDDVEAGQVEDIRRIRFYVVGVVSA